MSNGQWAFICNKMGNIISLVVNGRKFIHIKEVSEKHIEGFELWLDLDIEDKDYATTYITDSRIGFTNSLFKARELAINTLLSLRKYDREIKSSDWVFYNGVHCLVWSDGFSFSIDHNPKMNNEDDEDTVGLTIFAMDAEVYFEICWGGLDKATEIINQYISMFKKKEI